SAGSLGDLANPITLDGGMLVSLPGQRVLAPSRTLYLGPSGGYLAGGDKLIRGKITGPGFLSQPVEGGGGATIANGDNDYSGGTLVATGMIVAPSGKLGVGPVLI